MYRRVLSEGITRIPIATLVAILLCSCSWRWPFARNARGIATISFIASSGSVPQEHQWREEYVIDRERVLFSRSGPPEAAELNVGTWELTAEVEAIVALFDQIGRVDQRRIAEINPVSPVDGGGTEIYGIDYTDGESFSLVYSEGVTYENGELVTGPAQAFLARLAWPPGAASRYVQSE